MLGVVKWFNETKGYGFIKPDQSNRDVFIHVSALHEANIFNLQEGDQVEFEMGIGKNGRESATKIKLLK